MGNPFSSGQVNFLLLHSDHHDDDIVMMMMMLMIMMLMIMIQFDRTALMMTGPIDDDDGFRSESGGKPSITGVLVTGYSKKYSPLRST